MGFLAAAAAEVEDCVGSAVVGSDSPSTWRELIQSWSMVRWSGHSTDKEDLRFRQHTNFGADLDFRRRPCADEHGNANPCVRLSSSCLLHRREIFDRIACKEHLIARKGWQSNEVED